MRLVFDGRNRFFASASREIDADDPSQRLEIARIGTSHLDVGRSRSIQLPCRELLGRCEQQYAEGVRIITAK